MLSAWGCKTDCSGPLTGFSCSGGSQTTPDICDTICGDGLVLGTENCDDGSDDLNGCYTGCHSGSWPTWVCTGGSPTSATICVPLCGDDVCVGIETCDDGI